MSPGSAAVAAISDHLLDPESLALHRIEINIRPENAASIAVVRKLGFIHDLVHGQLPAG